MVRRALGAAHGDARHELAQAHELEVDLHGLQAARVVRDQRHDLRLVLAEVGEVVELVEAQFALDAAALLGGVEAGQRLLRELLAEHLRRDDADGQPAAQSVVQLLVELREDERGGGAADAHARGVQVREEDVLDEVDVRDAEEVVLANVLHYRLDEVVECLGRHGLARRGGTHEDLEVEGRQDHARQLLALAVDEAVLDALPDGADLQEPLQALVRVNELHRLAHRTQHLGIVRGVLDERAAVDHLPVAVDHHVLHLLDDLTRQCAGARGLADDVRGLRARDEHGKVVLRAGKALHERVQDVAAALGVARVGREVWQHAAQHARLHSLAVHALLPVGAQDVHELGGVHLVAGTGHAQQAVVRVLAQRVPHVGLDLAHVHVGEPRQHGVHRLRLVARRQRQHGAAGHVGQVLPVRGLDQVDLFHV
nr:MAG: hypothetical protein [Molluscum contagiosum virus]